MQALPRGPRLDQIALKWHDLAQRRLSYYTELYRSGRWRLYYTQEAFAARMLDVITAARKFAEIVGQPNGRPAAEPSDQQMAQQVSQQPEPRDNRMRPAA